MPKYFVLVNPVSGRKKGPDLARRIRDFAETREHVEQIEFFESPVADLANFLQSNLDKTFTDLIVIGGDGTLSRVANALPRSIPVALIPAGSGNDFAKTLVLGKTLEEQFETALSGKTHSIDLGVCNGQKFVNGVGVGFDGQIVADMQNRRIPLLSGQAKYYYHVLQILSSYETRTYTITENKEKKERTLILLTIAKGTTFGGGFKLTPHGQLNDGRLAVCEIGDVSAIRRYLNIHKLQKGNHDSLPEIRFYHTEGFSIAKNELLEAHIDGEYLGKPPFEFGVLPGAWSIRAKAIL